MRKIYSAFFLALALWSSLSISATSIMSTFDSGLEGWTVNNTTAVFVSTGGNPGGYMYIDNPETTISEIIAPAAFLGNLSSYNGGTFSFDGNMLQAIAPPYSDYGRLTLSGPGGTASLDFVPGDPPLNTWTAHSVQLSATVWGKTEAQWASILDNVTSLQLSVEAIFGGEIQGIDNIRLTSAAVPDAGSTAALLGLGVGGLAFARCKR